VIRPELLTKNGTRAVVSALQQAIRARRIGSLIWCAMKRRAFFYFFVKILQSNHSAESPAEPRPEKSDLGAAAHLSDWVRGWVKAW